MIRPQASRQLKAAVLILLAVTIPAEAQTCRASYYAYGTRTASGERFDRNGFTAAHRTMAFGTRLRVSLGGRSVVVRITDRGPFVRGRCLDVSLGAARVLGMIGAGVATVRVEVEP